MRFQLTVLAAMASIVFLLPAAETLLLHPGRQPSFGGARSLFLWLPILLTAVSYLATRYWLAGLLVAAGQFVALTPYLATIQRPIWPYSSLAGLLLAVSGMAVARIVSRKGADRVAALDRQWIDFRDTFGVFWALRVMERMNAAAVQHGWEVVLRWNGFVSAVSDVAASQNANTAPSCQSTFRGLVRRFVSNDWLAARTKKPPRLSENEAATEC